jgi:hypothetical protein
VTALSSLCRGATSSPAAFVARALALGATEIAADATLDDGDGGELAALLPEALRAGLRVVAFEAASGTGARRRGGRAPDLATVDRDERLAAARALEQTLRRASEAQARLVIVRLGSLPGHDDAYPGLLRAFARRALEREVLLARVETRRSLTLRALDLARWGLDLVVDAAAAAGLTLGLVNRARWYDIPSAGETEALLAAFAGAPLLPFHDVAAAHVRRTLGFGAGRPEIEIERACGAFLTDAAGLRGGLPWGTGEADPQALAKLPAGAPRIVHCLPLATDAELARALAG